MDWHAWHEAYDRPDSALSRRLGTVVGHITAALDAAPPGPVRVVSVCAGQGLDLFGALDGHPRAADVRARLVELDPRNTAAARAAAAGLGLTGVEVVTGDASLTDAYAGAVPADVVLVVGVLGNIGDADIERTVRLLPGLCAPGATVVWSRHRKAPDAFPRIRGLLAREGFSEVWSSPDGERQGLAVHRYDGPARPLPPGTAMFTFVGYDVLAGADVTGG
ncbi:hypothetical protein [Actinacidiphila yeochonensis]|uniref:hypothetical protein n=1 Tax=Actinacidiphila yeochonensis TaxID=89050 RepID=UPI0005601DE3|nr:hypothetical protein [Actinacidiphila yeochonensis]